MKQALFLFGLICFLQLEGQEYKSKLRQGNEAFERGYFNAAEQLYSESFEMEPSYNKAEFNKANTLFKKKNYNEAVQAFDLQTQKLESNEEKAKAYHNLGNSQMAHYFECKSYSSQVQNQDTAQMLMQRAMDALQKSEQAYKNALRNQSTDDETRYNYAIAKKLLEQEMSENGGGGNGDQDDQEKENKEEQENQEKEEKNKQEEENKDKSEEKEEEQENQNNKQEDQEKGENEEQKKNQEPKTLSKEEAEQILEALRNKEQKLHQKLNKKKKPTKALKIEKDW
ncbi:MAG: hypothetical protein AAF487_13025 [Bacteroidota bacterium]